MKTQSSGDDFGVQSAETSRQIDEPHRHTDRSNNILINENDGSVISRPMDYASHSSSLDSTPEVKLSLPQIYFSKHGEWRENSIDGNSLKKSFDLKIISPKFSQMTLPEQDCNIEALPEISQQKILANNRPKQLLKKIEFKPPHGFSVPLSKSSRYYPEHHALSSRRYQNIKVSRFFNI